jgi:quercetin dioxygenase-like cupin family protein
MRSLTRPAVGRPAQEAEMLILVKREDAQLFHLPGRVWGLLLGPDNVQSVNASLGFATFPAGSSAAGHIHETQEEYIYVVSGRGRLVSDENTVILEAGAAVLVRPGERHATFADGDQPLELITAFSPPVIPGAYEPTR